MTLREFKQSDGYRCGIVALHLFTSIAKFTYKLFSVLAKGIYWVVLRAYRYVAK